MVFTVVRDAHQVVVVTVHGPLAVDDRPALSPMSRRQSTGCRPTRLMLRRVGRTVHS